MTTTVPKIYAFKEFDDVADAVADHIISAQNSVLFPNSQHHSNFNKRQSWNAANLEKLIASSATSTDIDTTVSPTTNEEEEEDPNNSNNNFNNGNLNSNSNSILNTNINSSNTNNIKKLKKKKKDKKEKKEQQERRFKIAISGGSLISVLNQGLLKREDIIWDKWDIYLADERLVPFDDDESNYGLAKKKLFDLIPQSQSGAKHGVPKVYHIDEALINDPDECADDYEKILIKNFAFKDSVKLPMFDLFLLGCAPDGHIASLFPNREQLREKFAWVMPVQNASKPPANRITLTVPVICHSSRVTFVVEGSTKAPILKTVFERPDKGLPSSIVNEGAAGRVCWFVDEDALDDVMVTKKKYKYEVDTYKNK